MLPLLALSVGLATGARAISAAEKKSDDKKADAQAQINAAFHKELARLKAKGTYEASPEGQTISDMMLRRDVQKTLGTERAKAAVEFEKEDEERRRESRRRIALNQSLGRQETMGLPADLLITEAGGEIPEDAVFSYRRVNSWDGDNPAEVKDQKGNPYFDMSAAHYIPKGEKASDRLNNAMSQISGKQYQYWLRTNPNLAKQWEGRIGSLMQQAALDYSASLDPTKAGTLGSRIPRLPQSIAEAVATTYGPELTIKIIENIFSDAQPTMKDGQVVETVNQKLQKQFSEVYGMRVKPDAKAVLTTSVNEKTGEAEIKPTLPDNSLEMPVREGKSYTPSMQQTITNIGKNINMSDAPHDSIVSEITGLAKYNNVNPETLFNTVVETRQKFFRAYTPYRGQSKTGGKPAVFDIWGSGTATESVETWNNYRDTMGIMTKLDIDRSIAAVTLIAPVSAMDSQTPEERQQPRGFASLYPYYENEDLDKLDKNGDNYVSYMESTYLGGQKLSDIVNKAEAAEDAVIVSQALMASYGDQSPAIPGFVGGAIDIVNGFQAQFGYMMKAIDASNDSSQQKEKNKQKLSELRDNLTTSLANVDKTNEIAVANAVQKYYEGVLVYSMAMALQGGNAAARTISDADIERIENLLNFGKTLGDTRVKIAVMRAIGRQMERQAKLGRAYSSKNEARVWAAWTLEQDAINSGQGYKDYIFAAIEEEVNRASGGAFYKDNPKPGMIIETPGGGKGKVLPNGVIEFT